MTYSQKYHKTFLDRIAWVLTVALFSAFLIFETKSWGKYVYISIGIMIFLLYAAKKHFKINISPDYYHAFTIFFLLFGFSSMLWARDSSYTFNRMMTVGRTLVCLYLVYEYWRDTQDTELLLNATMWAGFVVAVYAISYYGFARLRSIIALGERADNSFANINGIGMLAAFSLVIVFSKIVNRKHTWSLFGSIPAFLMTAISGSRKALAVLGSGILLVYLIKKINESKNPIQLFARIISVFSLALLVYAIARKIPLLRPAFSRMDMFLNIYTSAGRVDESTIRRLNYIELGIQQFKKTPILGIGIGNSPLLMGRDSYLHNNYAELLACGGLIGTIIYYLGPLYCANKLIRAKNKSESTILSLSLLIVQLIMDYGQVSYFSKDAYFYLMIFFVEVKRIKQEKFDGYSKAIGEREIGAE